MGALGALNYLKPKLDTAASTCCVTDKVLRATLPAARKELSMQMQSSPVNYQLASAVKNSTTLGADAVPKVTTLRVSFRS